MADFMQGLVAGQRVAQGWLDTYEAARRRKEERDLKARREGIMSAQPQEEVGYTAEQGQQLEAMASAINPETGRPYYRVAAGQGGYTVTPDFTEAQTPIVGSGTDVPMVDRVTATQPVQYAPQRVSTFLGQRYEGGLTPARTAALRERALVETITDPIERQRGLQQLRAGELTEMQIAREREAARLAQENERRTNANRDATARLAQQIASGSTLDVPSIYRLATEAGADPEVLVRSAADFLGLDEKTAKARSDKLIRDIATAATSETKFNELLAKSFDPDPADNIVPQLVRTRDGVQVMYGDRPLTQPFKDTKDLSALSQLSMFYRDQITGNPLATAVQLTALDAKRAQITASQAQTEASRATTQLRGIQGRAILDKAGADARQQDYNDRANALIEGYQAAMALGPQGRQAAAIYAQEYDQLRATTPRGLTRPPALAALTAAQRPAGAEKPVDVPEAGKRVTIGGRLMQTDGYGGYVSAKGVLPDEQATVLKKAGIPDNYASRVLWNNDSDAVMFDGKEYDPRNKRDMDELKDDIKAYDVLNQRVSEEARMRANPPSPSGFQGARTTGLGPVTTYGVRPGAESIYGR